MKEIEDLYKTGLLSAHAYLEVSRIIGNLQEISDMDAHKAGMCIDELEKQMPRAVKPGKYNTMTGGYECQCDGGILYRDENYCSNCGGRINWEET